MGLDEREQMFIKNWERSRDREGKLLYQFLKGLPIGMAFSLPIIILLFTGRYWFKRADMVANSELSPGILIIAVFLIALFVAVMYQRHKWEMKEQQYMELKSKASQNNIQQ